MEQAQAHEQRRSCSQAVMTAMDMIMIWLMDMIGSYIHSLPPACDPAAEHVLVMWCELVGSLVQTDLPGCVPGALP
jgi:hypothetical protein